MRAKVIRSRRTVGFGVRVTGSYRRILIFRFLRWVLFVYPGN